MSDYGITSSGFNRKRLVDIRKELQDSFKTVFGDDLDVSEESNAGALIDLISKKFATMWETMEAIYNSRVPDTAEGVSLDYICQLVAVVRDDATETSVEGVLTGDFGTIIPSGSLVSQDETEYEFELLGEVTLDNDSCVRITFEVATVIDSTSYGFSIDGTPYIIDSGIGATEESIMTALESELLGNPEGVTFINNGDGSGEIFVDDGTTEKDLSINAYIDLLLVSNTGQFSAVEAGAISVPSSTINTIVTAISGWEEVSNNQAGVTGSDLETDEELRTRRSQSLSSVGSGTDEAIQSNLLNEVDNVTSCVVISNRTSVTVDSRPRNSFEAIITGGEDSDIAESIWANQPSGIQSYGTTTEQITDSNGDTQDISFSRPSSMYLWVRYTLSLYDEETYPGTGDELIKEEVVKYAEENYIAGKDVIASRLNVPVIDAVEGVDTIGIELALTTTIGGTPSYVSTSRPITSRQIAVASADRVTILIP